MEVRNRIRIAKVFFIGLLSHVYVRISGKDNVVIKIVVPHYTVWRIEATLTNLVCRCIQTAVLNPIGLQRISLDPGVLTPAADGSPGRIRP